MTVQDGNLPTETGPQDPFPHGQITLDNLIHAGEIPTTIAVFITPGSLDPDFTASQPGDVNQRGGSDGGGDTNPDRRSLEYDTVDGTYASFLERDILSVVEAEFRITKDPAHRMVTGGSSGAICAFSCAWFRPDLFGKVLCWVGASSSLKIRRIEGPCLLPPHPCRFSSTPIRLPQSLSGILVLRDSS